MEKSEIRYPIGEQDFKSLREMGCVYVDKTHFIERIISAGSQYLFLARPRRFGKSLFLSTLRYFFEGQRALFSGLHIDGAEWNWEPYPVIRLDLNTERYAEAGVLDKILDNLFNEWEVMYGVKSKAADMSSRFRNIIKAAHESTGKQVVILVDEYDKPLVSSLGDDSNFEHYREKLASLYSNFKSSAEHIRLVFLTGVSRFSKLSVFSDLNNLRDISLDNDYADICGITERELADNFAYGIGRLADNYGLSAEQVSMKLKDNYDGYRFAEKGSDIYNPWSLLNCLSSSEIANYWNHTGMPTIIAESLKRVDADLEDVLNSQCDRDTLMGLDLKSPSPLALLYQTGYLTIKDYDRELGVFSLGVPNREVMDGLFKVLLPYYVKVKRGDIGDIVFKLVLAMRRGEADMFMKNLQSYFAGIPYELKMDNENNFHNALYILTTLLGLHSQAEVSTSDGRIDLLIATDRFIYIIELKCDVSASEALSQIREKRYDRPFAADGRKVIRIGVNYSSATRCIEEWKIEE